MPGSPTGYRSSLRHHLSNTLYNAKRRSIRKSMPFDLDLNYLESIYTTECPIFNIEFKWGSADGRYNCPSLDRIDNDKGYVKGNVIFVSSKANTIKSTVVHPKELYAVADFLWEKLIELNGN